MELAEFNLFSDKSDRIFLIFPSICPNFHGFLKLGGGGSCPPPLRPVSYAYAERFMNCEAERLID
jgi:hypothetical protein